MALQIYSKVVEDPSCRCESKEILTIYHTLLKELSKHVSNLYAEGMCFLWIKTFLECDAGMLFKNAHRHSQREIEEPALLQLAVELVLRSKMKARVAQRD